MTAPDTAKAAADCAAALRQVDTAGTRVALVQAEHLRTLLDERETLRRDLLNATSRRNEEENARRAAHQVLAHFTGGPECHRPPGATLCGTHGFTAPCPHAEARRLLGMELAR